MEITGTAESYLYRNEIRREDKSRSGRRMQTRSSGREGRGAAGRRGTYNLKGACYLLYSLDVVHFYTDQNLESDTDKIKKMELERARINIELKWESKTLPHRNIKHKFFKGGENLTFL